VESFHAGDRLDATDCAFGTETSVSLIDGVSHVGMVIGQRVIGTRRWLSRCSNIENTYMFKADYPTCVACICLQHGYMEKERP
jgi:hypothetical protein